MKYSERMIHALEQCLPSYNEEDVMNGFDEELVDAVEYAIECIGKIAKIEEVLEDD